MNIPARVPFDVAAARASANLESGIASQAAIVQETLQSMNAFADNPSNKNLSPEDFYNGIAEVYDQKYFGMMEDLYDFVRPLSADTGVPVNSILDYGMGFASTIDSPYFPYIEDAITLYLQTTLAQLKAMQDAGNALIASHSGTTQSRKF